ncbi:uncharacterized protein J3R85_003083 [Psidium guajava]|nr:uncharacterized protein J3R85_003083 [Psidium guajava]
MWSSFVHLLQVHVEVNEDCYELVTICFEYFRKFSAITCGQPPNVCDDFLFHSMMLD